MTIEHCGINDEKRDEAPGVLISADDPFLLAIKSGKLDLTKGSDFYKGLVEIKRLLGG